MKLKGYLTLAFLFHLWIVDTSVLTVYLCTIKENFQCW